MTPYDLRSIYLHFASVSPTIEISTYRIYSADISHRYQTTAQKTFAR